MPSAPGHDSVAAPVIIAFLLPIKREVVIAQALGEYVGLSVVLSSFSDAWLALREQLSSIESSTWMIAVVSIVVVVYVWSRVR